METNGWEVLLGTMAWAASIAIAARWAQEMYGRRSAILAAALMTPAPALVAVLSGNPLAAVSAFAFLLAAVLISRTILDPEFGGIALAMGAVLFFALTDGDLRTMGLLLGSAVVARMLALERWEPRQRVLHASLAAGALIFAVGAAAATLILQVVPLAEAGSPQTFSTAMMTLVVLSLCAFRLRVTRRYSDLVLLGTAVSALAPCLADGQFLGAASLSFPAFALFAAGGADRGMTAPFRLAVIVVVAVLCLIVGWAVVG